MTDDNLFVSVGRNGPDDIICLAPDFALYGMNETWIGPRWIAGTEGPGGPPATISLGHADTRDPAKGVTVTTARRDRYDRWRAPDYPDPTQAVAAEATLGLLAATWPDPEIMAEAMGLDNVMAHAEQQARNYQSWDSIPWLVDGVAVAAATWRFAGAWTGFASLSAVHLVVTAVGIDPHAVRLGSLTDATAYGFELGKDITIRHMSVGAPLPNPNIRGFHADHFAVGVM